MSPRPVPPPDPATRRRGGLLAPAVVVLGVVAMLAGCSGGGDDADPQAVLDAAAARLADLQTVHVEVSATDLPTSGSVLLGASGDAVRPASFTGTLQLRTAGITADVDVLSVDGQVYARLPFTPDLAAVDPADLGFSDPAALLDADDGIGRLLAVAEPQEDLGTERLDGVVVRRIAASIPGEAVAALLTSADPSLPFRAVLAVDADDQVRQVELTGPFYAVDEDTTYVVVLSDFDEPVEVPSPPAGG